MKTVVLPLLLLNEVLSTLVVQSSSAVGVGELAMEVLVEARTGGAGEGGRGETLSMSIENLAGYCSC